MRLLIIICLCFYLHTNRVYSQFTNKFSYKICQEEVNIKLNYFFNDSIKEYIKFNKDMSYSYYVDYNDKKHYQLSYKNSDSIKVYPYQYVLLYEIRDRNKNIIKTFTMDCVCKDKQLMLEGWSDLDEYLKPQIEVLKGKALSLDEVLIIAREKGFINVIEWEIDYQKNKHNEYKSFFPKLVWTLKEKVQEKDYSYKKVIVINAKNGKVLSQYEEISL